MRALAERGDVRAQHRLGNYLHDGVGVARDDAEAVRWLLKAAAKNYASSMHSLAFFYRGGFGVPQDEAMTASWLRKASELGAADAQVVLADVLFLGKGVPVDEPEGLKWFKAAADGGNAYALNQMGVFHKNGQAGLKRDDKIAFGFYRRVADLGDANAMLNLSDFHSLGWGTSKSEEAAFAWRRRAALAGNPRRNSTSLFSITRAIRRRPRSGTRRPLNRAGVPPR